MSIPSLPIVHHIEGPQPVYVPPEPDWEAIRDRRAAERARTYCANGHDFSVEVGPLFMCGPSGADVSFHTECSRCQTLKE